MTVHRALVGVAAAVAGVVVLSAPAASLDVAQAQRTTRERSVFVNVLDRSGKPATGLTVDDFTVRENGAVREVLRVEPATAPMQIAVLFDTSAAVQSLTVDLRKGLDAFIRAILEKSPDSQISLMSFGDRPTKETDYTNSPTLLQASIRRVFPRPGGGAYLLDAIIEALKDLKKQPPPRKLMVAFSSDEGPEFSSRPHQQIADALREAGVALWAIVLQASGGRSPGTDEERNRVAVLGEVTTKSGGTREYVLTRTALESKYQELAGRLLSQVAVTYGRPESLIPPDKLDVTLKRDGLRLLAPHWTGQ